MSIIDDYAAIQRRRVEIAKRAVDRIIGEDMALLENGDPKGPRLGLLPEPLGLPPDRISDVVRAVIAERDAEVLRQIIGRGADIHTTNAEPPPAPAPIWRGFNLNVP